MFPWKKNFLQKNSFHKFNCIQKTFLKRNHKKDLSFHVYFFLLIRHICLLPRSFSINLAVLYITSKQSWFHFELWGTIILSTSSDINKNNITSFQANLALRHLDLMLPLACQVRRTHCNINVPNWFLALFPDIMVWQRNVSCVSFSHNLQMVSFHWIHTKW